MIKLKKDKVAENHEENAENTGESADNVSCETIYHVLTITENGYGKRSELDNYRLQARAGKGVKAGVFNEKTGLLVGLKQISNNEDVILISDKGTIIRVNGNEISKFNRDSLGVRIMRVVNNEKIVSIAITPTDEEKEVEEQEEVQQQENHEIENNSEKIKEEFDTETDNNGNDEI